MTFSISSACSPAALLSISAPCDLNELAQQVVDAMQPMAEAASIRLMLKAEATPVEADPDRLLQVITNLLSNAIKFSPPDSAVCVEVEPSDGGVVLSVDRRGTRHPHRQAGKHLRPIPAGRRLRLPSKGWNRSGTRHLPHHHSAAWRAHLGRAQCRSRRDLPHVPSRTTKLESIAGSQQFHERILREGRHGADLRSRFRCAASRSSKALRKRNYRILEAENGEQAVHLAQQFSLGAILLGVSQQRRDGLLTLRALKKDPVTAQIPIVVLSLLSPEDGRRRLKPPTHGCRSRSTKRCCSQSWLVSSKGSERARNGSAGRRRRGPRPRDSGQF